MLTFVRYLSLVLAAALSSIAVAADPRISAADSDQCVVVLIEDLNLLRQAHRTLDAEVRFPGSPVVYRVDLAAMYQTPAVIIRKAGPRPVGKVSVRIRGDGQELFNQDVAASFIDAAPRIPITQQQAAIEPGTSMGEAPAVYQPDLLQLPAAPMPDAARIVNLDDITVRVQSDLSYPLISANNNCLISHQTAHPGDTSRRSIYVPLKSQLYDAGGNPSRQLHYLGEVPINPDWPTLAKDGAVTLTPADVKIHLPTEKWSDGTLITGEGVGGLGQLIGAASVDADGNLYYSFSSTTKQYVVRFNVAKAKFEAPPIDLMEAMNQYLPSKEHLPEGFQNRKPSWDWIMYVQIGGGRMYVSPHRHDILPSEIMLNGVFSFPIEYWYDPEKFRKGGRYIAGSIPGEATSLYERWTHENEPTFKIGPGVYFDGSYYMCSYPPSYEMAPWRIEINADGSTRAITRVTHDVYQKANRDARQTPSPHAGHLFDWLDYGVLKTSPGRIIQSLRGGELDAANDQELLLYYDPLAAMRTDPKRFAEILDNQKGPALAPCYMAVEIPGKPGHLLGVGEYGYYLADYDITTAAKGFVTKRFLTLDVGSDANELPVKVGLGPYDRIWWRDGDKQYLLPMGYTGIAAMLYSVGGKPLDRHHTVLYKGVDRRSLDSATDGPSMTDRYAVHGLDGRVHMAASNVASRSGNPYSSGLQTFMPPQPKEILRLSNMTRGRGTGWLRSRILFEADGRKHQQLVLAGGMLVPTYVEMMNGKNVPASADAHLFVYDCAEGRDPTDVLGFSLPVLGGKSGVNGQIFSRDGRYLITWQQGRLLTFDMERWRYVDGCRLDADIWEFTRPDFRFNSSPDGRIYICAQVKDAAKATFFEVEVSPQGAISLRPHVTIQVPDAGKFRPLQGGVIAFVADPSGDGSYDLCIGPWSRMPGSLLRVIPDFVPARTGS